MGGILLYLGENTRPHTETANIMKKYNTKAIVIKSQDYKDSDKIFTLLTPEYGLISAFAKGVRKITSKRRGALDTLNYVDLKITELPSGHKFIDEAVSLESFPNIKSSLLKANAAYELLRFTLGNSAENLPAHRHLQLLLKSLHLLDTHPEHEHTTNYVTLYFLHNLLSESGFTLELSRCANCQKKLTSDWQPVRMSFSAGGLLCPECTGSAFPISVELLKVLLLTSNGVTIQLSTLPHSDIKSYLSQLSHYAHSVLES